MDPGTSTVNRRLSKELSNPGADRYGVETQAFNLTNHPHFANPNFDIAGSGGFWDHHEYGGPSQLALARLLP